MLQLLTLTTMPLTTETKEETISRINQIIAHYKGNKRNWRIGTASIQRLTLLNVQEELHYFSQDAIIANEIVFNFIAQGLQVCNMSKLHSDGIYLYR